MTGESVEILSEVLDWADPDAIIVLMMLARLYSSNDIVSVSGATATPYKLVSPSWLEDLRRKWLLEVFEILRSG